MSNLVVKLPETNPYKLALTFSEQNKKVTELKKPDAVKEFMDIISKTFFDAGQTVDAPTLHLLAVGLFEDIKQDFGFIRAEEVKLAFRLGVRKEYGEYFGINNATLFQWLRAFQMSDRRKTALNEMKQALEVHEPILSKTEAEYEWKQAMYRQFYNYKKSGILVIDFATHQFKEFEARGFIRMTDEEKMKILEEAKEIISETKKQIRLNPRSLKERDEATKFIQRLTENALLPTEKDELKQAARKLAIKYYYDSIEQLKF